MVAAELAPSAALLEANGRLYELRERVRPNHRLGTARALETGPKQPALTSQQSSATGCQSKPAPELRSLIADLPDHLGWESTIVTATLRPSTALRMARDRLFKGARKQQDVAWRAAEARDLSRAGEATHRTEPPEISDAEPATIDQQAAGDTVKLYPDLALGMLQREQAAAGRIWLLLRYLDQEGQGWLPIDFIQEKLTANDSELRVCGRRQLRNLLQQGRGVFWKRDKERVWLKSAAKVTEALGVERLTGRPVQLPVKSLLEGIGQVRAHFYASFHSGRRSSNPISRAKLEEITHVPERTQRVYEQTVGVNSQLNIAIGPQYSEKEVQERAWRHGRATFKFIDKEGKQGPPGQNYVAWRLPNSYEGCHEPSPIGRQKKINQQLRELVMKGMRANGREKVERLFWTNGAAAGKGYNRSPGIDAYWPHGPRRASQYIIWGVIPVERR